MPGLGWLLNEPLSFDEFSMERSRVWFRDMSEFFECCYFDWFSRTYFSPAGSVFAAPAYVMEPSSSGPSLLPEEISKLP